MQNLTLITFTYLFFILSKNKTTLIFKLQHQACFLQDII